MKIIAISGAVAVAIFVLSWDAVEFADGYSGFPIVIPPLLPVSGLLFALAFLVSCLAIGLALVASADGHLRTVLVVVAVLFFAWTLSPWFLARSVFLRGFAVHLRQVATPEEIEAASQRCLALFPRGGRVYGRNKITGPSPEEEQQSKRAWDALTTFRFVRFMDDTCVIFVEPPQVSFTWGGALSGHWGIRVASSRSHTEDFQSLEFSDRIDLFRGN